MASLENGIGSVGGFVAGTSFVVEHQTLSGLGNEFNVIPPDQLINGYIVLLIVNRVKFTKSQYVVFETNNRLLLLRCIATLAGNGYKKCCRYDGPEAGNVRHLTRKLWTSAGCI